MKYQRIVMLSWVLSLLLWFPISGKAQDLKSNYVDHTELPKGVIGEVVQKLIAVVNANDSIKIKEFVLGSFNEEFQRMAPMKAHQNAFLNFYRQTGGISFHSIRNYLPAIPNETTIILKDENYGSWQGVTLMLDNANNHIKGLRFSPARTPSDILGAKITEAQLLEQTRKLVENLCEKDLFSGTVLIAKNEQVLYEYACGEASKRFHAKNNLDTKFNLGSMNKMFTATAIMQLVERGKLNLTDPIDSYIDESWLPQALTKQITVHHLLSHTSGLGSYFNDTYWNASRALYRSVEDFKPLVRGDTLSFTPGERFGYSNTGMLLLGAIIEKVTAVDYFDYIRKNIYGPAKMLHTDSYEMNHPVENLAIGYIPSDKNAYGWENNLYMHVIKGGPAGGGFSTVDDLHRFAMALKDEKLVSKNSLNLLWTNHSEGYGYGFSIREGTTGKIVGHGGGFPGLNSNLDIFWTPDILLP